MLEDDLFDFINPILAKLGLVGEDGEEFREPALDILRYYRRPVRLHWLPMLGRGHAVVAVARQPVDVGLGQYPAFLGRVAMAVNGRFPPGRKPGFGGIGLTIVVLTPEPIAAEDDAALKSAIEVRTRSRAVPLGVIRLNLGQEAMAFQLAGDAEGLFPEPAELTDALTSRFRRFVPLFDGT